MLEAIVLAGGLGSRLREIVPDRPKPMALVAGRPFLEIVIRSLATKGVSRVVLSLGFMSENIINHFGNHFAGVELAYVVEECPLGTGGAVRLAMTKCSQESFFVLNGDTFLDLEVGDVNKFWQKKRNLVIVARQVQDTSRYGRLVVEDGLVKGFLEKGISGPGLINAGCYVFRRGQLDEYEVNRPFSLETDYLINAVHNSSVDVFVTNGYFIDIGLPEDYCRAQMKF
jgi:D-glycero-alpha-D-manno-heptose 1-phosphate guanylyltransferase